MFQIKNENLRKSVAIVHRETSQLIIGFIASITLIAFYLIGKTVDARGVSVRTFMILMTIAMIYKVIRYRIHLNIIRKKIFRLTNPNKKRTTGFGFGIWQ